MILEHLTTRFASELIGVASVRVDVFVPGEQWNNPFIESVVSDEMLIKRVSVGNLLQLFNGVRF